MSLEFNFDEALKALEGLEKRVANRATNEVLQEGAEIMLEGQQEECPKGDTGKLEQSLGIGKIKVRKGNKRIQVGIVNDKDREVIYGYYQHYGFRNKIGSYWMHKAFKNKINESREAMKTKLIHIIKEK